MSSQEEPQQSTPPSSGTEAVATGVAAIAVNGAYKPPPPLPSEPMPSTPHDEWTGRVLRVLDQRFRTLDRKVYLAIGVPIAIELLRRYLP